MKKANQPFGEEEKTGTGPWLLKGWMAYKEMGTMGKDEIPEWNMIAPAEAFSSFVTAVLDTTIFFRKRMVRAAPRDDEGFSLEKMFVLVGRYMEENPQGVKGTRAARIVLSAFDEIEEDADEEESQED